MHEDEDDGSQERTGVVKAPALIAFSTGLLATRERNVGELRGEGPCQAPPLSLSSMTTDDNE